MVSDSCAPIYTQLAYELGPDKEGRYLRDCHLRVDSWDYAGSAASIPVVHLTTEQESFDVTTEL